MLTNNFYKIMLSLMTKPGQLIYLTKYDGSTDNVTNPSYILEGLRYVRSGNFSSGVYGTWFGTGTTPPTREDYKLETPITDGTLYSTVQTSPVQGVGEDNARLYTTHEVCNTGANEVTITEVGIFGCGSTNSSAVFLLDRTVLDKPVTIPAGGSKSIKVAIQFNYPVS